MNGGTCVAGQVLWSVGGKSIGDHFIFGTHKCAPKVASQFSPWKRQKAMSQTIICYFLSDSLANIWPLLRNISMKVIEVFKELFMQQYILRCLVEHWKWFQICGVPQVWRWRLRQRKQISCLSPPSSVKLPKTQGYLLKIVLSHKVIKIPSSRILLIIDIKKYVFLTEPFVIHVLYHHPR